MRIIETTESGKENNRSWTTFFHSIHVDWVHVHRNKKLNIWYTCNIYCACHMKRTDWKGKKDETTTWHWFNIKFISRLCITSDGRSHYIHLMEAVFEDYSIIEAVFGYFLIVLPGPPPFRQYYCTFHNYSNVLSCSLYTKWKQYKKKQPTQIRNLFLCVENTPRGSLQISTISRIRYNGNGFLDASFP